ncbi:sulfurtransferase TusA family protein [Streptomyces chromofuscus]|uniref:Uncharacterized protein n=1 Tax=Streptomyces chromofuscus TaxID=42881 RepID=A0A7M2TBT5_STRCW|nr:hypothetical protein [Streptomyces chromofuscus]QOV44801.1 hypothetical protein IPT68_01930 [Streptomyces chromofuscus]
MSTANDGTTTADLTVDGTDPAAPLDLPAWCPMTGHAYLGPVARHAPDQVRAVHALGLAAPSTPTRTDAPWLRAASDAGP